MTMVKDLVSYCYASLELTLVVVKKTQVDSERMVISEKVVCAIAFQLEAHHLFEKSHINCTFPS